MESNGDEELFNIFNGLQENNNNIEKNVIDMDLVVFKQPELNLTNETLKEKEEEDLMVNFKSDEFLKMYGCLEETLIHFNRLYSYFSNINSKLIAEINAQKSNRKIRGDSFVNIDYLLKKSQQIAANVLGIPSSTLSKKWKDASNGKKWPRREIREQEKKLSVLMENNKLNQNDKEIQKIKKKIEELCSPVFINLN